MLEIIKKQPKISASGQRQKMGLFNPQSREKQAHFLFRKREIWRGFARISEKVKANQRFDGIADLYDKIEFYMHVNIKSKTLLFLSVQQSLVWSE